jgi:hypothetical protein
MKTMLKSEVVGPGDVPSHCDVNVLDCPTAPKGGFESKNLFPGLSNRTRPPDPERTSPAVWEDREACKTDQLAGVIEITNTPYSSPSQGISCPHCAHAFSSQERGRQVSAQEHLLEAWRAVANAKLNEYRRQAWRLAILTKCNIVDKVAAVDRLWEIATAHALVRALGEDRVQAIIAEAFAP